MKNQNSKPKVILGIGRMRNRVAEPFLKEPLKEMSFPSLFRQDMSLSPCFFWEMTLLGCGLGVMRGGLGTCADGSAMGPIAGKG